MSYDNSDVLTNGEIIEKLEEVLTILEDLDSTISHDDLENPIDNISDLISEHELYTEMEDIESQFKDLFIECENPIDSDDVTINTCFNDWTDSLCKDGEISSYHYNNWCNTLTP